MIDMQSVIQQLDRATMADTPRKAEAELFLTSLINKTLRIHVTDGRIFTGTFKCTDTDSNIVIANAFEYQQPSQRQLAEAASNATTDTIVADMTSTYMGLIVVPGKQINKLEVEEFTSQVNPRSTFGTARDQI
ncbi:hypothetical protein F5Y08DRAFT_105881 [Xylaria arbuscula]|nr:hypothetical protein F5Y08DRAFT_105881 [Xylaria arbuscula]